MVKSAKEHSGATSVIRFREPRQYLSTPDAGASCNSSYRSLRGLVTKLARYQHEFGSAERSFRLNRGVIPASGVMAAFDLKRRVLASGKVMATPESRLHRRRKQ